VAADKLRASIVTFASGLLQADLRVNPRARRFSFPRKRYFKRP
jgi:hypothetical protein